MIIFGSCNIFLLQLTGTGMQCSGSGTRSVESVCFWASKKYPRSCNYLYGSGSGRFNEQEKK
jgi:hypothetical protein